MRIEEACWLLLLAVLHDRRAVPLGASRLGRWATAMPLGAGWLGRWAPALRGGTCTTVLNEGGTTGRRAAGARCRGPSCACTERGATGGPRA
jgi:hypothetical protein